MIALPMAIEVGSWTIRSWALGDKPALAKYANNYNVWINLRDSFPRPYTLDDAERWIKEEHVRRPERHFAIANPVEAVGGIGLTLLDDVHNKTGEVGYWLGEPYWGRGIATEALRVFMHYVSSTFDIVRMQANVYEWNPASASVLEKCGFKCEGQLTKHVTKDGKTIDQLLYAYIL